MFGRKRKAEAAQLPDGDDAVVADDLEAEAAAPESDEADDAADDTGEPGADQLDETEDETPADEEDDEELDDGEEDDELADEEFEDDEGIDAVPPDLEEIDWRADGPFDADEVELNDGVQRLDLGALVVTPFEGLQLQLQVNQETKQAAAFTAIWRQSGLEVALFAASAHGGMADELREDVLEEAAQAGGSATIEDGPFGPQVRRLLPEEGQAGLSKSKGGQRVHVSWVWFAEGPRWLLRGTLLGQAALGPADAPDAAPFVEFFRNIVVRRGSKPMVPGDQLSLDVPISDAITEKP